MTDHEDIAIIAGQLADLTRTVEQMANQLKAADARANSQQERADTQQERIDLAARELGQRPSASCGDRAPTINLST